MSSLQMIKLNFKNGDVRHFVGDYNYYLNNDYLVVSVTDETGSIAEEFFSLKKISTVVTKLKPVDNNKGVKDHEESYGTVSGVFWPALDDPDDADDATCTVSDGVLICIRREDGLEVRFLIEELEDILQFVYGTDAYKEKG